MAGPPARCGGVDEPRGCHRAANPNRISQDAGRGAPAEANRLHKALEDTGIKLDRVASDVPGRSGRPMLDALVAGTTGPEVLADLALGAVKHSMLIAYWHMFTNGEAYRDPGGDYFQRRDPARATRRLVAKLEGSDTTSPRAGHSLT